MEDDGAIFAPLVGPLDDGVLQPVRCQEVHKDVVLLPQLVHESHSIQGKRAKDITCIVCVCVCVCVCGGGGGGGGGDEQGEG